MKKIGLIVTGALIFIGSFCLALFLLYDSKLSGAEFVAFVIAFAVIGLVIAFVDEVQEFSLGGNKIKFRELKKEAEKTIAELKTARTETFRFLLSMVVVKQGTSGSSPNHFPIDSRLENFWKLYEKIEKFKCVEELKEDILLAVETLRIGQLASLSCYNMGVREKYGDNPKENVNPDELLKIGLNENALEKSLKFYYFYPDTDKEKPEKVKSSFIESINEYKKLYELKERLGRKS